MPKLFEKGVFLNPVGARLYVSPTHDEAVCERFARCFEEAPREVR